MPKRDISSMQELCDVLYEKKSPWTKWMRR